MVAKKHKTVQNYAQLAQATLGNKARIAVNIILAINLIGTLIAYTLVINMFFMNLIESVAADWFGFIDNHNFHRVLSLCGFFFMAIVTLPLQLLNDTSKFGKIGVLSIATLFFIMLLVAIQTPSYKTHFNQSGTSLVNYDDPLLLLQSIGMFTFALYLMDCLFLVKNDMGKAGTSKNVLKMGASSILMMLIPFYIIGVLGYLSFGNAVENIDLFPIRPALPGDSDIYMKIAQCLVIVSVSLANITRVIALKLHVFDMAGKPITWKRNVLWTMATCYIPSLIAWIYPSVNDWVSLLGAFCMTTLMIGFPAAMGIIHYKKQKAWVAVCAVSVWLVLWMLIGYSSAILTIMKMIGLVTVN